MPADGKMLSQPGDTLVAVADAPSAALDELERSGAQVEAYPGADGMVDLVALLAGLGRREVTSVLVEGGGTLLGPLFDLGLVDKVVAFVAPAIIGGRSAPSPVGGQGVGEISDIVRLSRVEVERLGSDVAIIGYCGD